MNWQLQEAKNKLGQVVKEARKSGPQIITVRGKESAVVMSIEDYRRIARKEQSLAEFFARSPLRGTDREIERLPDFERDLAL
jgi:prevent-host-death family protein